MPRNEPDSGVIRPLLPSSVAVSEGPIAQLQMAPHPEEEVMVAGSAPIRRRAFVAGRTAARQALASCGASPAAILAIPGGAPIWPAGWTGSIAHSRTYAGAAVARRAEFAALGVDIEAVDRFRPALEGQILTSDERLALLALPHQQRQVRLAAAFCAKEAFYKAQNPLTGRRLGFHDVEVTVDIASGTLEVRLVGASTTCCEGLFRVEGGLAAAAVAVPDDGGAAFIRRILEGR